MECLVAMPTTLLTSPCLLYSVTELRSLIPLIAVLSDMSPEEQKLASQNTPLHARQLEAVAQEWFKRSGNSNPRTAPFARLLS